MDADLAALQFGDSFFPSGAVSFSLGLETLHADGIVADTAGLEEFLTDQVMGRWATARARLPRRRPQSLPGLAGGRRDRRSAGGNDAAARAARGLAQGRRRAARGPRAHGDAGCPGLSASDFAPAPPTAISRSCKAWCSRARGSTSPVAEAVSLARALRDDPGRRPQARLDRPPRRADHAARAQAPDGDAAGRGRRRASTRFAPMRRSPTSRRLATRKRRSDSSATDQGGPRCC